MRLLVSSIAILIFTVVTVARTGQAPGGTKTQHSDLESIVQIEKALFKAKMTSDSEVIRKFVADDWVNYSPDGLSSGKAELMEHLRQNHGELPAIVGRQEELKVFVFGDTAVAVYVEVDTAKPGANLPFSTLHTDATDVFVKAGGEWKLKMSRGSPRLQQ
jgi:ketosteroid isomerase-like protein